MCQAKYLFFLLLLAGCAGMPDRDPAPDTARRPEPGTLSPRLNGQIYTGVGVGR